MKPLSPKQRQLLALIPEGGILLWMKKYSTFAVISDGELLNIGKGWGPTLEALYYRRVLNPSEKELPKRYFFGWGNAHRFEVRLLILPLYANPTASSTSPTVASGSLRLPSARPVPRTG